MVTSRNPFGGRGEPTKIEEDEAMTTIKMNTAIQSINDIQQQIESFEAAWDKAIMAGEKEKADDIDRKIDQLLAIRKGMETIMSNLKIRYDRKDFRTVDLNGYWTVHTVWYLV